MSAAAAVPEKRLHEALEEMHLAAGGAGAGHGASLRDPPLTPSWLASELKHENEDDGPDLASHFLENPTAAKSVFVVLWKTDGDIDIMLANELDVWETVHGLYNLAELGITDKEAEVFIRNRYNILPLEDEVACAEGRLAELEGGIDHRMTLLVLLDLTSSDSASIAEEAEQMQVELDRLNEEHTACKAELVSVKGALQMFTKRVRLAVVAAYKPLRRAVTVRELLRKYEEEEEDEAL
jgi:hypothetical protein